MKLVTFEIQTPLGVRRRLGAFIDRESHPLIVDLNLAFETYLRDETDEPTPRRLAKLRIPPDMIGWIRGREKSRDAAEKAVDHVSSILANGLTPSGHHDEQLVYAFSDIHLLSPLPRPRNFRSFSLYEEHGSRRDGDGLEVRRGKPSEWYRWPPYSKGSIESIRGPQDDIPWPYYSNKFDIEPELGIVINRKGRNLTVEQARDYVAGYTIVLDCSDRGGRKREPFASTKRKDFATVVGPCLVTPDEFDETNVTVRVTVDGDVWFEGAGGPRSFLAPQLIAYLSDNETVYPGELLSTGTVGRSCSIDIRRWLTIGQTYKLEMEGIGALQHKIVPGEHVVDYIGSGMVGDLVEPSRH